MIHSASDQEEFTLLQYLALYSNFVFCKDKANVEVCHCLRTMRT
jgi:hypothetical protein